MRCARVEANAAGTLGTEEDSGAQLSDRAACPRKLDFHSHLPDSFCCENMLLLRLVAGFPAPVLFDA